MNVIDITCSDASQLADERYEIVETLGRTPLGRKKRTGMGPPFGRAHAELSPCRRTMFGGGPRIRNPEMRK